MPVLVPPDCTDPTMIAAARTSVRKTIKARARHYARTPWALEALHPGLASAPPPVLIAIAEHLVLREERSPRRWFGFGGEIGLINARAALLLGRALRLRGTKPAAIATPASPDQGGMARP